MPDRPEIVCICGSTRFVDEMRPANRDLTFAGVIVLAPSEAGALGESITDDQKTVLDALHRRKIDLADRVLVVNPGGYVGESTSGEIAYARATGKVMSFTSPGGPVGEQLAGGSLSRSHGGSRLCKAANEHGLTLDV